MPNFIPVDFDPFAEVRQIEKITFTNEPQREIWLSCIIGGDDANLSYNESVSLQIKGDLNVDAFQKALDKVVLRHEALRSTISPNGETLIVYDNVTTDLNYLDASHLNADELKDKKKAFLQNEMNTPLDMQNGPLFKTFLHKTGEQEYFFTMIKHHVIGDGWSTGIILEDLSKFYNAFVKGQTIVLNKASQLSDYASAQAGFRLTQDFKDTEEYWLNLYKDNVPVVDLPTDRPRRAPRTYKGNRIDKPLSKEMVAKLKAIGAKSGASLVTTLLAAFEVFLYQETQQKDIVVGLPSSGQAASGLTDVVGHCVNLLPLKTHIYPSVSFADYLKKRKSEVLDAYDHQRFTFGELIKKLYIPRDASRITLVPVMFNIDMGMDNAVAFDGLTFKLISNPRAYENFELYLNATGSKDGILLEWSYNTGLFDAQTIEGFHNDYFKILEGIIANPSESIADLVGEEAVEVQVEPGNDIIIPLNQTINTLFDDAVKTYFNKTAVSFKEQSLSYLQLNEKAEQLAAFLIQRGVEPGDIVGLSLDRSIEMLVCLLGVLKAGAVYLPLDPEFPLDRIEFMLEDSAAKILLISQPYKNKYQTSAQQIVVEEIWPQLDTYQKQTLKKEIDGNDRAYILYTSGSTGKPKGVKITHHNLANFLVSMNAMPGIKDTDRLLAITTISFDIAGLELYLPLIAGAELVIADSEATRDGRLLLSTVKEKHVTMMQATPSTWQMMLDSGWQQKYALKILAGGEALPKDLAEKLLNFCDELWNMYGPTETTIWSTVKQIMPGEKLLTIGKPINNTQVYIMDERGRPVPTNETGEIYIGGDGVAEGYLNRPELTAEKFVTDPYAKQPGAKLYRTGDLGKILDNGEIQCLGRIDHQVKIRGHRIELGEIESIIAKQSGVKQAVVLAREDSPMDKRLIAYVTLEEENGKDDNSSWKDRWDTLYETGAEEQQKLAVGEQKIDGTLLEHISNSEELKKQSAEWLQTSVARIKKLNSKRIYEIGSGAGQILFELAPGIEYYMATDYAQAAINNINDRVKAEPSKWKHVEASAAPADDFSAIGDTPVDLVLIHSVAQYFANADYLIDVVKKAIGAIKQGGCIFIGDMQGKNSLEMCHAMDFFPRASDSASVGDFNQTVANRVRIEDEFVADPAFFYALPKLLPNITGVDVQLRQGQSINETTKYHYDVWLYINTPVEVVTKQISKEWNDVATITNLQTLLTGNHGTVVEVRHILNSRTAKDHELLELLHKTNPETPITIIKDKVKRAPQGTHPDLFWELGVKLNYDAHVRWTTDGTDGLFDVVFIPSSTKLQVPAFELQDELRKSIYDFARTPVFKNEVHITWELIQTWKEQLEQALPAYMVPEDFIALKSFPLTPNAKIDRKALPKPQPKKAAENTDKPVIKTTNEQLIIDIWSEILSLNDLRPSDDFFKLGGHSLLAVKVMVAIEKKTGKRLPIATLFSNSTIEKLAKQLSDDEPGEIWDTIVPIKTTGTKTPIFIIHGSGLNVMMFRSISEHFDADHPLYGIQAIGLGKDAEVPGTVEEIAAYHIEEMMKVNPDGPYAIAGYSSGGYIAYEMAKQLIRDGKEVKMIGMIDTNGTALNKPTALPEVVFKKIRRQFHKVPFYLKTFVQYPKDALLYQQSQVKRRIYALFSIEDPVFDDGFTDRERVIRANYSKAIKKYKLIPQDIQISLFRVKKRLYYVDDQRYLGWDKFAEQGIKIYKVPGDHKTYLEQPNAQEFARTIQRALDGKK